MTERNDKKPKKIMVADVVAVEPVSGRQIPDIWEIYWEFFCKETRTTRFAQQIVRDSRGLTSNSR